VDYTAGSFYVGAWGSTIQWIKDGGGKADVEIDIYGGYKFELAKGTVLDLGVLTYQYPSNGLKPSANTTEVYGALTFGPIVAKYSHSTSNLFGFAGSKGSGYLDLSGTWEVAGISVTPHIGRQTVAKNGAYSYTRRSRASPGAPRSWTPTPRPTPAPAARIWARPRSCWAPSTPSDA
jgi:uncharacterized protein (TIGR02001 family)